MRKFYVSGKIAQLDLGAEMDAENPYMAAISFKERYAHLLNFGSHDLQVLEVEDVVDDK
ncbi:hypothetical protein IYQ92_03245 [Streptococcus sp. HF-1907]|uniref:hypothetical protein n=1 Tax=Streptococcus sp. HF-1907 TaxID=2785793 RepID=UPI00189F9A0A|nr:hypothetical protein [Streptococcus sp. HF-1907]MBF7094282.1 hypothetical protein [Streptococcus sp. HF-1907]